jgi:hypothetical protein
MIMPVIEHFGSPELFMYDFLIAPFVDYGFMQRALAGLAAAVARRLARSACS